MSIRDLYPHWTTNPGSNVDARQEALERDSLVPVGRSGGRIIDGLWVCPATARIETEARYVDCDHIIAIGECHATGGAEWPITQRERFANDLDNLVCTSRAWNRKKGARSPWGRLPPNVAWWREYVKRRAKVKEKYRLGMLPGEADVVKVIRSKAEYHEKGINLDRVRAWLGRWLPWVYSPL